MNNNLPPSDHTQNTGFTLIELAMIMVIIGLMLGAMTTPLTQQIKASKTKSTQAQLEQIHEALLAFAAINGRLPCPTLPGQNGLELEPSGPAGSMQDCRGPSGSVQHGFIPAVTLQLNGRVNDQGLFLDGWNQPIRYSVANSDGGGSSRWDFMVSGEILQVAAADLLANNPIIVCDTSSSSSNSCSGSSNQIMSRIPALFYSTGPNHQQTPSSDEAENIGGNLSGISVANDNVFVSKGYSEQTGKAFDDLIMWVSPHSIYLKMVDAGFTP